MGYHTHFCTCHSFRFMQRRTPQHSFDMTYDGEEDREPFKPPEDTIINDLTREPPPGKPPCPIHNQEQYAIVMQNKQNNCMRHMDGNDYSPIPQRTNLETELSMHEPAPFTTFSRVHTMPCGMHANHEHIHSESVSPSHCQSQSPYGMTQSRASLRYSPGKIRKLQHSPNNRFRKNINKKFKPKASAKSQMEILHVPYPHSNHQPCMQNHLPNVVILDQKSNPRYSVLYKLMEMNKDNQKVDNREERNNTNLNNTI